MPVSPPASGRGSGARRSDRRRPGRGAEWVDIPRHNRGLVETASEIRRRGGLSPVELTKTMLARIEALGRRVRAYYTVSRERALAAAERAEPREVCATT